MTRPSVHRLNKRPFQGSKNNGKPVRKQFLILDGKTVLAFLEQGRKIMDCANGTYNLKDVTNKVSCKVGEKIISVYELYFFILGYHWSR